MNIKDIDELCLNCQLKHCGYNICCPAIKNKANNKYKKLNNYVYENLKTFGNTIIGENTYKELGAAKIIKDLNDNRFKNVTIEIGKSIIIKAEYVNIL